VKTTTDKWLLISESRGDSNRRRPYRENSMNTPHAQSVYLTRSTHSKLSRSHQQSWAGSQLPRKRAPDTIHITSANCSMGSYPVSLLSQPIKQWRRGGGQSQPFVDDWLLGLSGPYYQHAIGTFNTCSWRPTQPSLTDTGRGYNLVGVGFPHITHWPSQLTVSTFHLRAPPHFQFNQNLPVSQNWV
jgi:hypothetical protein